ncbi:uncharacterized protein UMAG_00781 [Mycosarcoma maydis]|uniref:Uncharacterized protein n=1 Tax=Mycosarcoma maydis TaxID=5270 RepID=A0A0D1CHD8_MYCMD|nr:uncharacterized protein UMAG_00781 [Ustilago maydis 521]KIS72377.1 hypothetical protein UMAG_00781 [Ustilago maydis 521]|eukprot:XP_011386555.1 hypothetical protein UMAG_00781 [Ustilago maydis 521]
MKLNIAQALTCLTLVTSWSALAAPVPLQAEVSLSDSVKSWQSAVTDIDDKLQEAMEEHKAFSTKEKWAAGVVGGLSLLGTGGYIASSAIPVAKKKQQAEYLRGLQQAVATAKANAAVSQLVGSNAEKALDGGIATGKETRNWRVKRSAEEVVETASEAVKTHVEEDGESFHSATSRTPSLRLEDFDEGPTRNKAASALATSPGPHLESQLSFFGHEHPGPEQHWKANVEDHLSTLVTSVIELKQHQHDQLRTISPFTKTIIGLGLVNAVGGVVSAELSVQNTVQSAMRNHDGKDALPDVSVLDPKTCEPFANEIEGLDCSKAHGVAKS